MLTTPKRINVAINARACIPSRPFNSTKLPVFRQPKHHKRAFQHNTSFTDTIDFIKPSIRSLICAAEPSPEKFKADNDLYADLSQKIELEAAEVCEGLQGTSVYLVGMMGSGKSTVGKMLSQALGYCFFDTDKLIEQLAGKSIPKIFEEDGESDFRTLETQILSELAPFKNCIVATGGGAATKSENWGHISAGISIWLNGPPTLLANRVLGDGLSERPLLNQDENTDSNKKESSGDLGKDTMDEYRKTVEKLTNLLKERREQYEYADITVSLEGSDPSTADLGAPSAIMVLRVLSAVNARLKKDAATRSARMNFEVVNENLPDTMRVVQNINPISGGGVVDGSDPYMP